MRMLTVISLMQEVSGLLRLGAIRPITPVTSFDVSRLDQALLYLSKGQHIGKIVVTYEDKSSLVRV
jgi:NADPH:quinone reductase-like Zn-dependent oxidoreductase